VEEEIVSDPVEITLHQNYPNPFRDLTLIRYNLPDQAPVRLSVYDALGRRVAVLAESEQGPGRYEVPFATDDVSSGVYFYRLETGTHLESRQMLIVK